MAVAIWVTIGGGLLVLMALAGSTFARWPISGAMLYLAVGVALSPALFGLASLDAIANATLIERLTEVVLAVSLFTCGLKLSAGLSNRRWIPAVRLATLSMLLTVAAVAVLGVIFLDLSIGAAVLLGGILAPTDPVLASDVQVANPGDRDQLRFSLTGEGGLNDGFAYPFVLLGMGLLGLHDFGAFGWKWLLIDVVWTTTIGLGAGALLGAAVGMLVLYLRREHRGAVGYDNFLALGLIGLSFGFAQLLHAAGFLAVFAAGVAVRRIERRETTAARTGVETPAMAHAMAESGDTATSQDLSQITIEAEERLAVDPVHASAFMAHAMLSFNEQLDRIGEFCAVILLGMVLWIVDWSVKATIVTILTLCVVRPMAVVVGLLGSRVRPAQQKLIAWFGIRGIGSFYYLAYAITHGLDTATARTLSTVTLTLLVASICVHGVSVTPLMNAYRRQFTR